MDLKQIERLMASMEQSRIKRIVIKREDFEIEIERDTGSEVAAAQGPAANFVTPLAYAPPLAASSLTKSPPSVEPAVVERKEAPSGFFVTSPMVGTYYASPSPEDPPFVKEGDVVSEDTVVCIIEAMKVMNEVKAGAKGTVSAVMVRNGEPVEFGTHILRITPS